MITHVGRPDPTARFPGHEARVKRGELRASEKLEEKKAFFHRATWSHGS